MCRFTYFLRTTGAAIGGGGAIIMGGGGVTTGMVFGSEEQAANARAESSPAAPSDQRVETKRM